METGNAFALARANAVPVAARREPLRTLYSGMTGSSWSGAVPRLYDALMRPLEHAGMARWRSALWADVPDHGHGLEIGVGTGAGAAARGTHAVVATDVSESMLARARRAPRAPTSGPDAGTSAALAAADVQALPFRDGAFDWAVASLVFCEVEDPLAGLRELRRVVRPGGTLHLLEHVEPRGRLAASVARVVSALTGPLLGEHFDRRTHETVRRAGFTLERTDWALGGALVRLIAR